MVVTEVDEPPPPPPKKISRRKPVSDPVDLHGSLPLFKRRSATIGIGDGALITLSLIWTTKPRWRKCKENKPNSGWHPWTFGFIVIAVRVEY